MKLSKWKSSQDGCPECKGNNLDSDSFEQFQFGEISQQVRCLDCETSWTEVYRLSGMVDLTKPGE